MLIILSLIFFLLFYSDNLLTRIKLFFLVYLTIIIFFLFLSKNIFSFLLLLINASALLIFVIFILLSVNLKVNGLKGEVSLFFFFLPNYFILPCVILYVVVFTLIYINIMLLLMEREAVFPPLFFL